MAEITIAQALGWKQTLQHRHNELITLRNDNSKQGFRLMGETEKVELKPTYDVKALDRLITSIAKELRILDEAIKTMNGVTILKGYDKNEDALGEIK